ncbi:MAG: glycosyltransferase family 39 protein [Chloroflexota bacterium]
MRAATFAMTGLRVGAATWPAETLVLGAIVLVAAFMRLIRLSSTSGDLDEGIRGIQLLLVSAGYRPMQEIFSSQGPLLLDMLHPLYVAFGETLGAARLAVGLYSVIGILGAYWAARTVGGPTGAAVAAVVLIASPTYLRNSRQALAELPAMAPAMLAVAAALTYQRSPRAIWLVLTGVLLAVGLLIKPIVIAAAVPVGLAVLIGAPRKPLAVSILAFCCTMVIGGVIYATGISAFLAQMVDYRLQSRQAAGWNLRENLQVLQTSLLARDQIGIFALGAGSMAALAIRSPRYALPLVGWVAGSAAILIFYAPLFPKHVVIAVPPLAVLIGATVGHVWSGLRERSPSAVLGAVILFVPGLFYLWSLPAIWTWDARFMNLQAGSEGERFGQSADLAAAITATTSRGEFVVTDHPYLALMAQRLVPPELADPSATRLRARALTGGDIVAAGEQYNARLVILWGDRFRPYANVRGWLEDKFQPIKVYGRGGDSARVIYARRGGDLDRMRAALQTSIAEVSDAAFGNVIRLRGFSLDRAELPRTGNVAVTYEWEALARANVDYHVISELRGPDGQVWSSEELSLGGRAIGVSEWQPGTWLFQTSIFDLPANAPSGDYVLWVGVYDSRAKADLPLTAGDSRLATRAEPVYRFGAAQILVR